MVELFKDNAILWTILVFVATICFQIVAFMDWSRSKDKAAKRFFSTGIGVTGIAAAFAIIFGSTEIFYSTPLNGHTDWLWLTLLYITWLIFLFVGIFLYLLGKYMQRGKRRA